jgi:integrase
MTRSRQSWITTDVEQFHPVTAKPERLFDRMKGRRGRRDPRQPAWCSPAPSRRGADSAALFISGRGTRMTTYAVADVIGVITRATGMDDHVTSHVLRHTFGTKFQVASTS